MTALRKRLGRLVRSARRSWVFRTLAVGALSTGCDLTVLISLVRWGGLDPVPAAVCGVGVGSAVNFFVNRAFSFKDSEGRMGGQALRYVLATGAAMSVHATVIFFLSDEWGLNYVLAKLLADVLVFAVGNLAILRLVVFPRHASGAKRVGSH